jgi:hypothetical protein
MTYVKYTPVRNIHNHDKLSVKCAFFERTPPIKYSAIGLRLFIFFVDWISETC